MLFDSHMLKGYTRQERIIARSSAETELYAAALEASESKGCVSMMCDLGCTKKPVLVIDAKVTEHILHRHEKGRTEVSDTVDNLEAEARDKLDNEVSDAIDSAEAKTRVRRHSAWPAESGIRKERTSKSTSRRRASCTWRGAWAQQRRSVNTTLVRLSTDIITPTHSRWLRIATEKNQSSISLEMLSKFHDFLAFRTKLNDVEQHKLEIMVTPQTCSRSQTSTDRSSISVCRRRH